MRSVAFYNAKAGVGCTSLVYHLAWTFTNLGYRVIAVDADPQADLSGLFLGFDAFPWVEYDESLDTRAPIGQAMVYGVQNGADFITPVTSTLGLVLGDLELEEWIAEFSHAHGLCHRGARSPIPDDLESSRLRRLVVAVGEAHQADLVLIDAGAGLGVAPCLAVTAADALVWPVPADPMAELGLTHGASAARAWTTRWQAYVSRLLEPEQLRQRQASDKEFFAIGGAPLEQIEERDAAWLGQGPRSLGYVLTGDVHYGGLLQNHVGIGRPSEAMRQDIAETYLRTVGEPEVDARLGELHPWVDLLERSLRVQKPMFELTPADGAIGSTVVAVERCRVEFEDLARTLAQRLGVTKP